MARPRKDSSQPETRTRILEAARIEFASQGLAAPLDQIAARCGIRRPSLLHHFPSKEHLVDALLEEIVQATSQQLLAVAGNTEGSAAERLAALFRVLREVESREKGVAGVLLHLFMLPDSRPAVQAKLSDFLSVIEQAIFEIDPEQLKRKDDVKAVLAHLLLAELTRVALGKDSEVLWGSSDALALLFDNFFSLPAKI